MRHTPDHRQTVKAGSSSVALPASNEDGPVVRQRTAHRLLATMAGAALAISLSGCVPGAPSANQPGPAGPAAAASPGAGPASAGLNPGDGATGSRGAEPLADTSGAATTAAATETVKQTVTDALGRLAAGAPKPATAQVGDALTGAGIAPGVLEVSQSRTPTGLEADAIEAAVLQGSDCIIGQVRDGAVAVTVLPVLASGKCFVGS